MKRFLDRLAMQLDQLRWSGRLEVGLVSRLRLQSDADPKGAILINSAVCFFSPPLLRRARDRPCRGLPSPRCQHPTPIPTSLAMTHPDRILRIRTVLDRTGLSRSTLYRKIADGSFPPQVKLGEHSSGWRESAIDKWIADPVSFRAAVPVKPRQPGRASS